MDKEVLKQVFENIKIAHDHSLDEEHFQSREMLRETFLVLEEALKQEQVEPLEYWNAVEGWVKLDEVREHFDSVSCATIYKNGGEGRVPLCLAQPNQEHYEPVAWLEENSAKAMSDLEKQAWIQAGRDELVETYNRPLYTAPQTKEWTVLSDEEIKNIIDCGRPDYVNIKKAEQKLKEKNGY